MSYPLFADDSFPPRRNEPCFCGSGRRFKNCCGDRSPERAPPHGVGIVERFLARSFYKHHADAYHLVPEQRAWKKVVDRDLSILIYLNDGYDGG